MLGKLRTFLRLNAGIVALALFSNIASAAISSSQLAQLQARIASHPLLKADPQQLTLTQLKTAQNDTDSDADTLLKSKLLTLLSNLSHPSAEQRAWVAQQTQLEQSLFMQDSDHHGKLLRVVDIASQAQGTIYLWSVNQHRRDWQTRWDNFEFQWPGNGSGQAEEAGLIAWIESLSLANAQQVAVHLLNQGDTTLLSTKLLSSVALAAQNEELLTMLWRRPADAYVYAALQKLPARAAVSVSINQLVRAAESPALTSLAMNGLATHHSDSEAVVAYFKQALRQPSRQWLAAASLGYMADRYQARQLAIWASKNLPGKHSALVTYAQQVAERGASQ